MKQVVTFGEIMMRLSPPGYGRLRQTDTLDVTYGGGEANVAVALAVMGVPAAHVTALPDSELGQATAGAFRRYGVDMRHTVFSGQRLGLYFLETGTAMRASRIIYDRDRSAFAELDPAAFDWERILTGAGWLHWTGISPAISAAAATACSDAIRTARRLGLTISADVNYRRNLWQYGRSAREVMPELVAECDVLVCGTGDAADIFDIRTEEPGADGFAAAARHVMDRFPQVKHIISTERDSVSATHNRLAGRCFDGSIYTETPAFDINPIVDRIGGGDAFMGGYIYGRLQGWDVDRTLVFATAASALKHTIFGDFNLVTVEEVEQIVGGDLSGRLVR